MESLIPNNNKELLAQLQDISKELLDEIHDVIPEDANLEPVAGEWSVKEVVSHLRDAEQIWNQRMNRILEEDEPFLRAFNPDELATEHDYQSVPWDEVVVGFETARRTNLEILEKLEPSLWLKGGIHQERGHVTISELADAQLSHSQNHLEQIRHVRWLAK